MTPQDIMNELVEIDRELHGLEGELDNAWTQAINRMKHRRQGSTPDSGEYRFPALRSAREGIELSQIRCESLMRRDGEANAAAPAGPSLPGAAPSIRRFTPLAAFVHHLHDASRRVRAERLRVRTTWALLVPGGEQVTGAQLDPLDDFDARSRGREAQLQRYFTRHLVRFYAEVSGVLACLSFIVWFAMR
jgi:hypothetical protein